MLPAYTTYLIDLDGVVYRGEEVLPGAREFISWLDRTQKKYLYLTNNSFSTGIQVVEKLKRLGIATDDAHVLSAGEAAVKNIAHRFAGASVYVIGEPPLYELVREHGLQLADAESSRADVVLVGLDRSFNYQKLTHAVQAILAGAVFIVINRDPLLPIAGLLIPGCGTMVAAIEAGTGVSPEVVGKPEPTLLQEAIRQLNSTSEETVMIGDNLGVDILAGQRAGTHTLLVLSGKDTRESLARSAIQPELVYEDLAAVMADIAS